MSVLPPRRARPRRATVVTRVTGIALATGLVLTACGSPAENPPPAPNPPSSTPLPPPAEPEDAPAAQPGLPADSVIGLPPGAPEGAVVDPASGLLAVALRAPDRLALTDLRTREVRTVPTPGAARHLVAGAPGEVLLLAENTDVVARISLPSGEVTQQVAVGRQPHDAAQVGDTTFVTNEMGGSVGVVRGGRMVRELPGLAQPGGITAAGDRVAAVDVRANRLHVFDGRTGSEIAILPAGQGPSHVRPLGQGKVAVADTRGNAVLTFDITGQPRQVGTIALPGRAYGMATDPDRGWVYVTLANTNQVAGLKMRSDGTLDLRKLLPTVQQPNDVATDPRTGTVYSVGTAQSQVQVIPPNAFGA